MAATTMVPLEAIAAHPDRLSAQRGWSLGWRVWRRSLVLDRRLAEEATTSSCAELALRAQQLCSTRSRRALANGLTRAVEAAASRPAWVRRRPLAVAGVLDAAAPLRALAVDVVDISEPPVRGVALVSFLLCEPGSPLYDRRFAVTVREMAQRARAALVTAGSGPGGWRSG